MMKGDVRHEEMWKLSACVDVIDFYMEFYGSENEVFLSVLQNAGGKKVKRPSMDFYARLHRFKALEIFSI